MGSVTVIVPDHASNIQRRSLSAASPNAGFAWTRCARPNAGSTVPLRAAARRLRAFQYRSVDGPDRHGCGVHPCHRSWSNGSTAGVPRRCPQYGQTLWSRMTDRPQLAHLCLSRRT
jgi:hypothetical protein